MDNLWPEPLSWQITKARNEGSMSGNSESRSYLEKKLVFCFGSHVAAQMLLPFGEENFLSSSELKQAQEIATRMVIQNGWGPDDNPAIYYYGNADTALSMGNNYEYEMATKVEKDLERMLQDHAGIGKEGPFFLSGVHGIEPLSSSFLDGGNASTTTPLSGATQGWRSIQPLNQDRHLD